MTSTRDKTRSPPIRDAATLILFRHGANGLEVLMGKRHGGNAFMPNSYVFPGGRMDPEDYRIRPAAPLSPVSTARLARAPKTGPRKALALALAAIRETFEETGLRIAGPAPAQASASARPLPRGWREFSRDGILAPDPSALVYVCRAITPPKRTRRFDARFFVAPAETARGDLVASEELGKLHWVTPEAANSLDLPTITKIVLSHLPQWVAPSAMADPAQPVPVWRARANRHVVTLE